MTKAEALTRRTVVDEYGDLAKELAPWKAKQARFVELAKIIRGWYADADATVSHLADGDRWTCLVGPKGNESVVDKLAAWSQLGRKKFIAAASLTLTALNSLLPEATVASLTTKVQTGSRALTAQEKVQEKVA